MTLHDKHPLLQALLLDEQLGLISTPLTRPVAWIVTGLDEHTTRVHASRSGSKCGYTLKPFGSSARRVHLSVAEVRTSWMQACHCAGMDLHIANPVRYHLRQQRNLTDARKILDRLEQDPATVRWLPWVTLLRLAEKMRFGAGSDGLSESASGVPERIDRLTRTMLPYWRGQNTTSAGLRWWAAAYRICDGGALHYRRAEQRAIEGHPAFGWWQQLIQHGESGDLVVNPDWAVDLDERAAAVDGRPGQLILFAGRLDTAEQEEIRDLTEVAITQFGTAVLREPRYVAVLDGVPPIVSATLDTVLAAGPWWQPPAGLGPLSPEEADTFLELWKSGIRREDAYAVARVI